MSRVRCLCGYDSKFLTTGVLTKINKSQKQNREVLLFALVRNSRKEVRGKVS